MDNEVMTARILAPTAFAINFAAQLYGIFSSPNMKEIADRVCSRSLERASIKDPQSEPLRLLPKPSFHWCILCATDVSATCLDQEAFQRTSTVRRCSVAVFSHLRLGKYLHW